MRVLMLGWEFPPHISGGLGTACQGLTEGLAQHGVEVLFVVPRAFGDEDASHMDLLGLNDVVVEADGRVVTRVRRGRSGHVETTESKGEDRVETESREERRIRVIEIPSLLEPYLTADGYEDRIEDHDTVEIRRPVEGGASAWQTFVEEVVETVERETAASAPRSFGFGGGYGAGLFEEVARYAHAVTEVCRHETFDVIHAHDWMTVPAGAAAAHLSGKPLVVHVHATEYDRSGENPDPRVRDIELLGLRASDRVVTVSHFTAGILERRYGADPEKIRVVHNAVTQEESRREGWEKTIPDPVVLFLGRVTFQKGPDYFLEAARRVVEQMPGVKFVVSGSGDMLPGMIEHAARLGIARNVHFTGFLRGRDVERMYAIADLYVMPSVSEPFGITPLEAMALDVPVIVSRQSGVAEILQHALKVDFWDVDDLANKILAVLRRPVLRDVLRDEGRAEVRRLRWESSGAILRRVYEELVP